MEKIKTIEKKNLLKKHICTDNINHYVECIYELANKVKKFRDIPSYVILDDDLNATKIDNTKDLYNYIMNDIAAIYMAMKNDDDIKQ